MPSRREESYTFGTTETLVSDQKSTVAVIVTHPWGPLGGNLHNNVVVAACLYFQRLGVTTARFDFNGGIGRGFTQVAQVLDVARGLLETLPEAKHILLVGYSYGSLIAASASADLPECMASVSIAPPFSVSHWLVMFHSNHHLEKATRKEELPRLLLIGTQDNFTSEEVFQRTLEQHYPEETTTGAVIKDADHFFRHREKDVMDVIGQWLVGAFPQLQGDLQKLRSLTIGLSTAT